MISRGLSLALAAAAWFAGAGAALAADGLGTAGPFRSVGWASCGASYADQMQGACDPPPVDPALSPAEQSDAHIGRALKLLSYMRMDEARSAAERAVAANPNNAAAWLLRARFDFPGRLDAAEAALNAGLLLSPADPNLLATRAYVLMQNQLPEALRDANAALRSDSDNADALWIRSHILGRLGQLEAADDDLTRALAVEPEGLRVRQARAMLRLGMRRYQAAIEDADLVLAQRPFDFMALQLRAVAHYAAGENNAALEDLSRILGEPGQPAAATPTMTQFSPLFLQRAVLLARLGRKAEATRDVNAVIDFGGPAAAAKLQLHLRRHGFPDVPLDGKRSQALEDAAQACFVDEACGRGLAAPH